ncbi:MAG: hypothetical protein HZA32_14610 [Opitutae bacterium]|nr:hypothetical protein [Opitutae bacterium]
MSATLFALSGIAQSVSVPPADVPLRAVVSPLVNGQPLPPVYEISLKWNQRDTTVLLMPFKNGGEKVMKVLGVQATRGVFIADFPSTIPAGKEEAISIVYSAADNTDGDIDAVRVLTDQGIKEVHLRIARETVVQLSTRELHWAAGETLAAKTVKLTVVANTVTPKNARALGNSSAVLEKLSPTEWNVKVAPGSTTKSGRFVVLLEFDGALPGKATTILGIIDPKE